MRCIFHFRWLLLLAWSFPISALAGNCTASTPEAAARQIAGQLAGGAVPAAMTPVSLPAQAQRYRVHQVVYDPLLHTEWVMVADCVYPSRPLIAVPLPARNAKNLFRSEHGQVLNAVDTKVDTKIDDASPKLSTAKSHVVARAVPPIQDASALNVSSSSTLPVLIKAGDRVVVWQQEPDMRLEIEAMALEYGRAGQVIHLRRGRENALLIGVVRGPGSVQLMP